VATESAARSRVFATKMEQVKITCVFVKDWGGKVEEGWREVRAWRLHG
jgi:hypothetical protein